MMVSTLEASQQQHLATLLGLAEDMKYYMELLSGFLEQQAKFVTQCKLEKQKVSFLCRTSSHRMLETPEGNIS